MPSVEDLYKDYGSLDPTVVLALSCDVPDWTTSPESEAELRALLSGLNSSAETEAAVAALDLEQSTPEDSPSSSADRTSSTGDGTPSDSMDNTSEWPEELAFLTQICPAKPKHALQRALRQNDGDIENTLNQISAEEVFESSDLSSNSNSSDPVTKTQHHLLSPEAADQPSKQRKARRRKIKEPKKNTFSLTSTPRAPPSNSTTVSAASSTDELGSFATSSSGDSVDNTLTHLAALMDTPMRTVKAHYDQQGGSLVLTVEGLLDHFEKERPFDKLSFEPPLHENVEDGDTTSTVLEAHPVIVVVFSLFPDQSDLGLWRRLLCGSNGHLEAAVDLHMALKQLIKQNGTPLQAALLQAAADPAKYNINPHTASSSLKKGWADVGARKPEMPKNWIDLNPASPMSYATASVPDYNSDHVGMSAAECSARAQEYRDKRNAAYKSASETFSRGKHSLGTKGQGMRAAAAYLAERGRELDAMARKWDSAAAQSLVSERQARSMNRYLIDLHNLTVNQALETTTANLSAWWHASSDPKPFTIITGKGSHSAGHTPLILPAVEKMLSQEGWRYSTDRHQGQIIVRGVTQR